MKSTHSRTLHLGAILGALAAGFALPVAALAPASTLARSSGIPSYTFVSAPNLHPPELQVLKSAPGLNPGDFLAGTMGGGSSGSHILGQGGPLLMDDHARPVWYLPNAGGFDPQQQTYQGKPVLMWFGGKAVGEIVIYNEHYQRIAAVQARAPWSIDLHDASIVGGDIWITVARQVKNQNLTRYGGPRKGNVYDVGLQEFDVSTGRLLRTWDALNPGGHPNVPLSASKQRATSHSSKPGGHGPIWDAYHLNSVQGLPDGDLLVSMRNTWAVYLIDPAAGRIVWTLGGRDSTFKLGAGSSFAWQHDARLADPGQGARGRDVELTLFNDNNDGRGEKPSAGLVLSLDTITNRATLVAAYRHHPPLSAQSLGSMQLLPNGNALVGWGSEPYFSEYSSSGRELLEVRWPGADASYRTLFTNSWVGTPYYPPSGAVRGRTVYASWNGATQVGRWEVLAGPSTGGLTVVATTPRTGFETAIKVDQSYGDYEVRALSASGQVLGTSKAFS